MGGVKTQEIQDCLDCRGRRPLVPRRLASFVPALQDACVLYMEMLK
jgi:hypothetical protein